MSVGLVLSDRFRLISQLGAGGMGSVWLARDMNLETEVAIKLIDPALIDSPEAVNRFRQEAQAAAMIRSTHVVQILDHGIDQGRPYMAMELLTGEDLGQRLERVIRLSPEDTATILGQVARAVTLAHSRGIVHRDLKPENVFLAREGDDEVTKVLDFGIARRTSGLSDSSLSRTRTGTMLGTPYYMSPEQATGQPVDHLTDIWAFGVIAYECLTGQRAFEGDTVGALFHAICMLKIPVPSAIAAVPPGFDEWFARAAVRDPASRFSSIREAANRLCIVCGVQLGTAAGLAQSSGRLELSSYESLSATAVSAVPSLLDRTTPPSAKTLTRRARKRPVLLLVAGVSAVLVAAAMAYGLSRNRDATLPRSPGNSSPTVPSAMNASEASAPASASPSSSTGKSVAHAAAVEAAPVSAAVATATTDAKRSPPPVSRRPSSAVLPKTKKSDLRRDDNAAGI